MFYLFYYNLYVLRLFGVCIYYLLNLWTVHHCEKYLLLLKFISDTDNFKIIFISICGTVSSGTLLLI